QNLEVAGHAVLVCKRMRRPFKFQCLTQNAVRISAARFVGVHQPPCSKLLESIRMPRSLREDCVDAGLLREICKTIERSDVGLHDCQAIGPVLNSLAAQVYIGATPDCRDVTNVV